MKIAILGWGSLLWDEQPDFDEQHDKWDLDGPTLKIEFSRVSAKRDEALTLVVDEAHGVPCKVAYCLSYRPRIDDAVCDLGCREGTSVTNIGRYSVPVENDTEVKKNISNWAAEKKLEAVIWTALRSNFQEKSKFKKPFSVENALVHLQALDPKGKSKAAEYVWRAPTFVDTPLRRALQVQAWFKLY